MTKWADFSIYNKNSQLLYKAGADLGVSRGGGGGFSKFSELSQTSLKTLIW